MSPFGAITYPRWIGDASGGTPTASPQSLAWATTFGTRLWPDFEDNAPPPESGHGKESAEVLKDADAHPEREDAVSNYVQVICPERLPPERDRRPGLVEVATINLPDGFGVRIEEEDDGNCSRSSKSVVEGGRRVVCTVGNYEALSSGYIDCLPSQVLADTGATLSLVDYRVLKRLRRTNEHLRPYEGQVRSSSGHHLRVRGWIRLPVKHGSMEMTLDLLVADKLHADAILGVDALGAFGAVIDVAEKTLTLKRTEQVLALGVMIVHQSYLSKMAASIRLPPRGQALVIANVVGDAPEKATVLVEGSLGLPPTLCVARTVCTVNNGQVVGVLDPERNGCGLDVGLPRVGLRL
ncbi:hypothetical protein PR003_g23508 [Phytophthora rubi]|uniref:Peptidase A2 domain-containing protein n=1 Tax=Phytophthora rubi TaxID=129364 RepID=A0A6A4CZ12_9STRA|nr:hypothetical protein PR003_g23508 [Phytophthora rubi]